MIENKYDHVVGGGYGMGGSWIAILLVIVVVFILFKDGFGRDGKHDGGYGYGFPGFGFGGCGPCVQPTFKDESNFEEERNINAKLCKIELEQQMCCCKELEATHCEGEKTRALIEQNYIQDLRDKLAESNMKNMTLKQEMFTTAQLGMVSNKIEKVDEMVERLMCELPKRPPVFAECVTPNTHDIDCRRDDFRFRDGFRRDRDCECF